MTHSRPWLTALFQILVLLAFVAVGSPWLAAEEAPAPVPPPAGDVTLRTHQARRVFTGSIVPGGVYSAAELRAAIEQDPIVAAHYRGVDLEQVHAVTLTRGRAAYVSYRGGDRVYWTRHRVWLKAGETLLTDGSTTIRARCGNCVSDAKHAVVAAVEPAHGELDDFVVPPTPDTDVDAFAAEAEPALGELLGVPFGPEMLARLAPGGALLLPDLTDGVSAGGDFPVFVVPPIVVSGGVGGTTAGDLPTVPLPPPFVPGPVTPTRDGGLTGGVTVDVDGATGDATTSSSGATPVPETDLLWLVATGVIGVAARRHRH